MTPLLQVLRLINGALERLTAASSTAIAGVMVLALTLSAVTRYISGTGYDWFIELPPALVPWMVFPLLGPLLRSGAHIQVDLMPNLLRGKALLLLLKLFVYGVMLAGAVIFFVAGNEAVALFQRLGQLMELEVEIPIWWMYLAFPVGFAILAMFALELLLETAFRLFSDRDGSA